MTTHRMSPVRPVAGRPISDEAQLFTFPKPANDTLVFPTMGTMVSLRVPLGLDQQHADAVRAVFAELNERYTMYVDDSEAMRVSRGDLPLAEASADYRAVRARALYWQWQTGGAFTPFAPDGRTDLSGIVKAVAIERAGHVLADLPHWCLNVGGDILVQGLSDPWTGRAWSAGIVDPDDRQSLSTRATLSVERPAVATSGVAERGEHVWRTDDTALAQQRFVQVTVQAADIVTADVAATAILAGGRETLDLLCSRLDLQVIAFGRDGDIWATPAFRAA